MKDFGQWKLPFTLDAIRAKLSHLCGQKRRPLLLIHTRIPISVREGPQQLCSTPNSKHDEHQRHAVRVRCNPLRHNAAGCRLTDSLPQTRFSSTNHPCPYRISIAGDLVIHVACSILWLLQFQVV